ncbi:MAG TPA: DUF6591 domain-containing protein [Clostridia bacterium]|nr:DUF6591 domain-containing protein [Clostridia bacterium]
MLRKLIILSICIAVLLSFVGCGYKRKVEEKLANKITEGILDKVAGNNTNVNIEDDKITIEGEDGSKLAIGSSEWPEGKAADLIPEFKRGKIASTMDMGASCTIIVDDVERKDFDEYLQVIKDKGYTKDSMDMSTEELISYFASYEKDKSTISLGYTMETKEMMISITIQE